MSAAKRTGNARTPVWNGKEEVSAPALLRRIRIRAAKVEAAAAAGEAEIEQLAAEIAALQERNARLRAQLAAHHQRKVDLEREATQLGRKQMRLPCRARLDTINRLRDAIAGLQAQGRTQIRMEALVQVALRKECRRLEQAFHDGKPWPPRSDDLPAGRTKRRKRRAA